MPQAPLLTPSLAVDLAHRSPRHPAWVSAMEAARENPAAATWIERFGDAERARSRLADVLDTCRLHVQTTHAERTPTGLARVSVHGVQLPHGLLWVDGRAIREDHVADPKRAAQGFRRCHSAYGVAVDENGCSHPVPLRDGSALCPLCAAKDAATRAFRWAPVVRELVGRGYGVAHLTLTQPVGEDRGRRIVLSERERRRFRYAGAVVAPDEVGYAVPGEPLNEARDRLLGAWLNLRNSQASRNEWRAGVAGYVYGVEWTARKRDRHTDRWALRYHVHLHALLLLRPTVGLVEKARWQTEGERRAVCLAGPWWDWLTAEWSRQTAEQGAAATREAQWLAPIASDQVESTVMEVLKYPFKPTEMTAAQVVEALACTKGTKPNQVGGVFHASSKVGAAARALMRDRAGLPPLPRKCKVCRQDPARQPDCGVCEGTGELPGVPLSIRLGELDGADQDLAGDLADAYETRDSETQPSAMLLYVTRGHAAQLSVRPNDEPPQWTDGDPVILTTRMVGRAFLLGHRVAHYFVRVREDGCWTDAGWITLKRLIDDVCRWEPRRLARGPSP